MWVSVVEGVKKEGRYLWGEGTYLTMKFHANFRANFPISTTDRRKLLILALTLEIVSYILRFLPASHSCATSGRRHHKILSCGEMCLLALEQEEKDSPICWSIVLRNVVSSIWDSNTCQRPRKFCKCASNLDQIWKFCRFKAVDVLTTHYSKNWVPIVLICCVCISAVVDSLKWQRMLPGLTTAQIPGST